MFLPRRRSADASKPPPDSRSPHEAALSWPRRAAVWVVESLSNSAQAWIAAIWIGAAGLFLSLAWSSGPQPLIDAARYSKFTSHVTGTIVESWLAVELETRAVRAPANWRASALASPCAVIEYRGDWSADPARRAFCGNRLEFSTEYTLAGVLELAPGVPFRWPHDARGFIVPEIRIDEAARTWLATHPPADTFMHGKRPAKTILDELRFDLDEPVDAAIAGWLPVTDQVPLAFDPQRPDHALPVAVIAARSASGSNWIAAFIGGFAGLVAWFKGMSMLPLVSGLAAPGRWLLMILPLATLPWWGTYLPQAVAQFNSQWASVVRDMFADVERTTRFVDSAPENATLSGGTRLVWDSGTSVYADSLGRFKLTAPTPAPSSADSALATLTSDIVVQVRTLDDREKIELFSRLKRDVDSDQDHAGIAFLPAAKETVLARSDS